MVLSVLRRRDIVLEASDDFFAMVSSFELKVSTAFQKFSGYFFAETNDA